MQQGPAHHIDSIKHNSGPEQYRHHLPMSAFHGRIEGRFSIIIATVHINSLLGQYANYTVISVLTSDTKSYLPTKIGGRNIRTRV